MPATRRRIALLLVATALGATAGAPVAGAQGEGQPSPGELEPLTPTPQVPEEPSDGGEEPIGEPDPARPSASAALPDTGADPRGYALVGLSLLVVGAGLRLRTQPERF